MSWVSIRNYVSRAAMMVVIHPSDSQAKDKITLIDDEVVRP